MKILAVSDIPADRYYKYFIPGKLDEFDLILSCGDLPPEYLEFLVTMAKCPLVYVHGNHDDRYSREPEGCICADDKVVECLGVRIAGLGGSYRYGGGKYMYTENQMKLRKFKLSFAIKKHRGIDILLTHAPAKGINDLDSLAHRGFDCFKCIIEKYEPKFFVHGHVHRNYGVNIPQRSSHGKTTVINAFEYCIIDLEC